MLIGDVKGITVYSKYIENGLIVRKDHSE